MIRPCEQNELELIWIVINDGAQAYARVIPADRWKEPYMSKSELQHEIDEGVRFWAYDEDGEFRGVMGIQDVGDVTLIRHAYVRATAQGRGIGSKLLSHLTSLAKKPLLIGTWADAVWAIRFYERHGFAVVSHEKKEQLLRKHWSIPERQIETSVVLASPEWLERNNKREPTDSQPAPA